MQENTHSPRVFFAVMAAVVLVLVTICLGGGTTQNSQSMVFVGIGALLMIQPFQKRIGSGYVAMGLGVLFLAAIAFLPSGLFEIPPWRPKLQAVGVQMSDKLSPQPWLTAHGLALLAAGLVWLMWLMSLPWNSYLRRSAARCLAYGIVLIAGVALVTWWMGIKIPGWLVEERGFGPFPNRNHTGHVLAIGGVLAVGCAFDAMRWNRGRWGFWLFGAMVILAALVVNYSRGGLLLFFGSLGLWAALSALQRKSWKLLVIAFSALLVTVAVVLVKGGATAERLAGGENSEVGFRFKIWSDTLQMCAGSPWCGVGLENFTSLFPFYRQASIIEQTVLHPESDWLLVAAEMGWFGVLGLAVMLVVILKKAFPFASGSQRRLRLAAFSVAVGAALHGWVDVPGHRLGCILLSVFVLIIARRSEHQEVSGILSNILSRGLGVIFVGLGFYWFQMPDHVLQAENMSVSGNYRESYLAAEEGLQKQPLNWQLYFIRAKAELVGGKILAAVADFRRARVLEPHYPLIAYEEGMLWTQVAPGLAIEPWKDTLSRAKGGDLQRFYNGMLGIRPKDIVFRSSLLDMVHGNPALQLQWFKEIPAEEALLRLDDIRSQISNWSASEQEAFKRREIEITSNIKKH